MAQVTLWGSWVPHSHGKVIVPSSRVGFLQILYVMVIVGVPRPESLEQSVSRTFTGHFCGVDHGTMQI